MVPMPQHDEHDHDDQHPGHRERHQHRHQGHANDQGVRGALRYLRFAPSMWRSDINEAVVDMVGPQPGERVVDVGAGMGAGTVLAARAGAAVTAVEPTTFLRRILFARCRLQRARRRIDVVDGTAEHLPVDDGSIDAVWAVNTMHHWNDPERGSSEIARVLRPGGRVVLVDEDFDNPDHPEFERFGGEPPHDHGFTMVDAGRMGELLATRGLVDIDASNRSVRDRPCIVVTATAPIADD